MKNIKWIIGVLFITLVVIFTTRNQTTQTNNNLTIGALAPLTGQVSVLGERMRNGMELAREDIVDQYEIDELDIIYEDACDAKSSLNASRKLVQVNNVPIIASSFCLPGIDAVAPFTEENDVIFLNTAANPETTLNKNYVFSTNFTIANDSENIANYIVNELKAKTAAMIHLDTSFGESYRNNFTTSFESVDGQLITSEAKLLDATDFRIELTKIKEADPDVLIIIHFGSSLGNAIKQARELGLDMPIIGDYESEDTTVLEFAGEAAEGLIISSSTPEIESNKVLSFKQRYIAKYGEEPDVLATNAYDAVMLSVSRYLACDRDVKCTKDALESVSKYEGVSGLITIDPDDHSVIKPNIFKIVKDGKFVEIK